MKNKKQTLKLLFVDLDRVDFNVLSNAMGKLPIMIVGQVGRFDPFLLDTGVEVEEVKTQAKKPDEDDIF